MQIEDKYLILQMPEEIDHHQAVLIRKQADEKILEGEIMDVIFDFSKTQFNIPCIYCNISELYEFILSFFIFSHNIGHLLWTEFYV